MADFQFNVDTTPMAHSVDTARGHLNGVTVAVTAMEAAVIASERSASKKICDNVDNGFYMLVKSQISQKAVIAFTEMTSKQITMLQLIKALDNIKRQMEGDFNMIARRYSKLFNSLNKALESRIKELDRPAMQLADIKRVIVFDKLKDEVSALFSISEEALPVVQTALSGKLKQKTRETLLTLAESICENSSYSEKVDSILVNDAIDSNSSDYYYQPAVFFTTDSLLRSDDSIDSIFSAQNDTWQITVPVISEINKVHNDLPWTQLTPDEKSKIRKEFMSLCESGSEDGRLSNEIIRLFDESSWEVLGK